MIESIALIIFMLLPIVAEHYYRNKEDKWYI